MSAASGGGMDESVPPSTDASDADTSALSGNGGATDETDRLSPILPKKPHRETDLEAKETFEDDGEDAAEEEQSNENEDEALMANMDPRVRVRAQERKRRMKERQRQADEKRRREEARRMEVEVREEAKREKRRQSMLERRKSDAKKKKDAYSKALETSERGKNQKTAKQHESWALRRIEALLREQDKLKQHLSKADEEHAHRRRVLEATRYPIDDRLLKDEPPLDSVVERPAPTQRVAIDPRLSTEAIVVWDFLRHFSSALELSSFSLNDFLEVVQHMEGPTVLLGEIFCVLCRMILSDKQALHTDDVAGDTLPSDFLPRKVPPSLADALTYAEVLCYTLPLTHAFELLYEDPEASDAAGDHITPRRAALQAAKSRKQNNSRGHAGRDEWLGLALASGVAKLRTAEPHSLEASEKIALLRCLCTASYNTATIRGVVSANHAARLEICKRRDDEDRAEAKAKRERKLALTEDAIAELAPEWAAIHQCAVKEGEEGDVPESQAGGDEDGVSPNAPPEAPAPKKKKKKKKPQHGIPAPTLSALVDDLTLADKLGKRYLVADLGGVDAAGEGDETEDEDEETLMLKLSRREMLERRQRRDRIVQERRAREQNLLLRGEALSTLSAALASENIRSIRDALRHAESVGLEGPLEAGDPRAVAEADQPRPEMYNAWICSELFDAKKGLMALEERKRLAERRRQYDRELSQLGVRTEPLGEDRAGRWYYVFPGDERVYVQEISPMEEGDGPTSLDRRDPARATAEWWFYETEAEALQLVAWLDARGVREKLLKEALQAVFDVKLLGQSGEALKGEEVEWHREGHDHLGQRVRRRFGRQGTVNATIVGWLPASENEGLELFHIKHDDGDKEDLDPEEVNEALKAYAAAPPTPTSTAGGASSGPRPFTYYENRLRAQAPPGEFAVGLAGLKQWVVDAERLQMLPKLQALRAEFASTRNADRRIWMDLLLNATRVGDVAQAIATLEEHIHGLQTDEDVKDDDTEEEEEDEPREDVRDGDYETESEAEEEAGRSRRRSAPRASTPLGTLGGASSTLWPSGNARETWRKAVLGAATSAQAALAFRCLLDHAIDFGAATREADDVAGRPSRTRLRQQAPEPEQKKLATKWH